jgi:hypothetical protein
VASSALLDCPSCDSPLAALVEDQPVRESVRPRLTREDAVAATRAFWEGRKVPRAFLAESSVEEPILVFVPFHERVRTLVLRGNDGPAFVDRPSFAPAVRVPGVPIEKLDALSASGATKRESFDAAALQRRALVFDPTEEAPSVPAISGATVVEDRAGLVWLPVWLVRCRHARNLYEAVLDGTSGSVLHARAPMERSILLPEAIFFTYVLAFVFGMPLSWWGKLVVFYLELHPIGGLVLAVGTPGVVFWVLAFAWDRVRFRYEWTGDRLGVRREPVNRPGRTLPEKIRDGFFDAARWLNGSLEKTRKTS